MFNSLKTLTIALACVSVLQAPAHGSATVSQAVPPAKKASASHAYQSETVRLLRMVPVVPHAGVYHTKKLAGSSVSDLYAWYIGHRGTMSKRITVDWNRQLARLCARKTAISKTTIVRDTCAMLVAEYERLDPERMSIERYQALAGQEAKLVYRSLSWEKVGETYFKNPKTKIVNERKLALLKRVSKTIDGRTLVAYAMTELLPTAGNFGQAYLDFLLRNAGRRYVESLPALHDPLTSFGPFQFTAHAVYDAGNVATVGGASKVNRALPLRLRIPGSVALFRGDAHLRAAELFAISNLAVFIRRLDERHLTTFERIADTRSLELAQFIATAHNKPEVAYASGIRWLNAKALPSYQNGCPKASQLYAAKTKKNFLSLVIDAIL